MRAASDWMLAVLGMMTLLVFAVMIWWFGPWHATLAFGVWALLTAPLLIVGYRKTHSRWLLYLGSGLLPCGFVVATMAGSTWWGSAYGLVVNAVAAGLPLAITMAWLGRLLRPSHGPQDQWTSLPVIAVCATAAVMTLTVAWARKETARPTEDWTNLQGFAGCYEVEIGRWIPSVMLGHAAQGIVPERIRLDTTRGDHSFESNKPLIRPGWPGGEAYWMPSDAETVELHWHNGFNGVGLTLHRRGSELRGRAVGHTDVGGFWPESRALVRARSIDCASVPTDTIRMQRRLRAEQKRGK